MKRIAWLLLAALLLLPSAAFAEEYTLPASKEGKESFLTDRDDRTFLSIGSRDAVTLGGLDSSVENVLITWFHIPGRVKVEYLNAAGEVLRAETRQDTTYYVSLPTDGAAAVRLSGAKFELAGFVPVHAGESLPILPNDTPCDALVLLTHPGDEMLVAAPLLKALTDCGLTVQIAYLYTPHRDRIGEAIASLQALGILREPYFCDFPIPVYDTPESGKRRYSASNARKLLAALADTYAPKLTVIDTLGAGENLLPQVEAAAEKFEKLYVIAEDGTLTLPLSEADAPAYDAALDLQTSQRVFRLHAARETKLRLIGEGAEPLLEGIAVESFLTYASPTPEPTPEPTDTPEPIEAPTPEPTNVPETPEPTVPAETPEPTAQPSAVQSDPLLKWGVTATVAVLLIFAAAVVIIIVRRLRRR